MFDRGRKFRVTRPGAHIDGLRPVSPWTQQPFRLDLKVGTVLTCDGISKTHGDGYPMVKWLDANGEWICNDAIFHPSNTMGHPGHGFMEPITPPRVLRIRWNTNMRGSVEPEYQCEELVKGDGDNWQLVVTEYDDLRAWQRRKVDPDFANAYSQSRSRPWSWCYAAPGQIDVFEQRVSEAEAVHAAWVSGGDQC